MVTLSKTSQKALLNINVNEVVVKIFRCKIQFECIVFFNKMKMFMTLKIIVKRYSLVKWVGVWA